jgi:putative ABC transport system permease protein
MHAVTLYRALLRCYPAAFRDEYGEQMLLAFTDQLHDAPGRARRAAVWTEAARDALAVAPREHWHVFLQDLRYALRTMAARPGFTAVAVLSLALGIGANTALFSLWNGVLRASLPGVQRPEELVMLTDPGEAGMFRGRWEGRTDGPRDWVTYEEFQELRDRSGIFASVMASQSSLGVWQARVNGENGRALEEVRGRMVSGTYFQVLGANPASGRVFTADADRVETPEAVISHSFWQRRFGGRDDVIGRTVTIRNATLSIVGIMPPAFVGETSGQLPDLWVPLGMQPRVMPGNDYLHDTPPDKPMWLHLFGRLKPGVSVAEAEARANAVLQANLTAFYGAAATGERRAEYLDQRLQISDASRGASSKRSELSGSLTALLAGVGVLLLIACANLANLLLARGTARRAEMTLRLSLGAGRGRLMRQLVTESLVLAVCGGLAAAAVAATLHRALVVMLAEADPAFTLSFTFDAPMAVFLVGCTFTAALLFGLLPAWQATATDASSALKEQGRGAIGSRMRGRSGRLLVGVQLALSLPLLVGAGLLTRTAYNVQRIDLGLNVDDLLIARVDLRATIDDPARRDTMRQAVLERIGQAPGVRSATFSHLGLFTGAFTNWTIEVEGYTPPPDRKPDTTVDAVGPGYFTTVGMRLIQGRDIQESDTPAAPKICVINEAFANRFFERRNPMGLRITSVEDNERATYLVVGVAKDARTRSPRQTVEPRMFIAGRQQPPGAGTPTFLVRAQSDAPIATAVRQAIMEVDANAPLTSIRTARERLAPLTAQDRAIARLALAFGLVALALAAIGLYGVLSYGVARRTSEIAVRIALGARPARVIAMILGETAGVVALGIVAGGVLAFAASRFIAGTLFGVDPRDPATFAAAVAVLLAVAGCAAYLPARRASTLEPVAALRTD